MSKIPIETRVFSGQALARLRRRKGFSQSRLASLIGLTQGAIANWERDIRAPKCNHLGRIAEVLECAIDDLFKYPEPTAEIVG